MHAQSFLEDSQAGERLYACGAVNVTQWENLTKLATAPQKTLIINSSVGDYSIPGYLAKELVSVGVAKWAADRKLLFPTEYGLSLISTYGLDGR